MRRQEFGARVRPFLQALAAALPLAASASTASAAAPITLRFDWQPGMECAITESTLDLLAKDPPVVETWTYVVEAAPAGLRISNRDSVSAPGDPSDPWSPTFDKLVQIVNDAAYFVGRDGGYADHENMHPLLARMRLLRVKAPDGPEFDDMIATLTDPRVWDDMLRLDWLDFAGNPRLRQGQHTVRKSRVERGFQTNLSPVVDGAFLFLDTRVTLERVAPCSDAAKLRCVTLTLKQAPTDAEMSEAVNGFRGYDRSGLLLYTALRGFVKTTTIELEPDTAIPHSSRIDVRAKVVDLDYDREEATDVHWRVERRSACAVPGRK